MAADQTTATKSSQSADAKSLRYMIDSYGDWAKLEGPPIYTDFGFDLFKIETGPWPRLGEGCTGAFVHLKGRGDHMTIFVIDVLPGAKSAPQKHIYDEIFVVLDGHGSCVVEAADGSKHSFEFGPRSMFAPPLNARYQIFNGSGRERVRLASVNDLLWNMNFFRSEEFIFNNPVGFPDRAGPAGFYAGEGEMTAIRPGRNLWETNFVADLAGFELRAWEARGAGSGNMQFLLTEGSIGAHISGMPVGTYKKAHRHGPGAHLIALTGSGFSLLSYEGQKDFIRHEWKFGYAYAPPDNMFHQHFNTGPEQARYVAFLFGSKRYPIIGERRAHSENQGTDLSIQDGGCQLEYVDQDPSIHAMWLKDMRANGVESKMGKHIDESAFG